MERILLIQENVKIANFLKKKLVANGFDVALANGPESMKELLNEYKRHYMVVIVDLRSATLSPSDLIDYIATFELTTIALTASVTKDNYKLLNNKEILDFCLRNKKEELLYVVKLVDNIRHYSTLTALVVDDSATARMIVTRQLKLMKFKVLEASDGIEALDILAKNKEISLVVTDYNMPNMNGIDLTINIRNEYSKEELIIVALTAVDTPENTAAFLKYGASGFIAKPLSKEAFNYTINNSMELNRVIHKNREYSKTIDENVAFLKVDEDFLISDVSSAFEKVSGQEKQTLLGKDYSSTFSDQETYKNVLNEVLSNDEFKGEIDYQKFQDSEVNYKLSVIKSKNKKGEMNGIFDIREDITDTVIKRKQEETILKQSKFTAMGELLKDIAHQWRQPLNVIALQMETLVMLNETGDLSDAILGKTHKDVGSQLNYLTDTINSFTSYFSKSRNIEEIDLYTLLDDTLKLFKSYLDEKNIGINITGESCLLSCDKERLSQVFIHMINNGVDAIEKYREEDNNEDYHGEISIKVDRKTNTIEIKDNGCGVEESIKDSVFNPYFTTKFKDRGVGLSLYISKTIIEELGGKITLDSVKNSTTFSINF